MQKNCKKIAKFERILGPSCKKIAKKIAKKSKNTMVFAFFCNFFAIFLQLQAPFQHPLRPGGCPRQVANFLLPVSLSVHGLQFFLQIFCNFKVDTLPALPAKLLAAPDSTQQLKPYALHAQEAHWSLAGVSAV